MVAFSSNIQKFDIENFLVQYPKANVESGGNGEPNWIEDILVSSILFWISITQSNQLAIRFMITIMLPISISPGAKNIKHHKTLSISLKIFYLWH